MENKDLEVGDMENMIQERVQRFIYRVEKEHSLNEQITPSIHMAPHTLRDVSPQSFSPRVVSIGPLHRDDENVQAFERQKATYLINLMTCMPSPQETIMNSCMQKVYASMEKIKACYVLTKTYDDAEFAEMMVMDACFILGFILQVLISWSESNSEYIFQLGDVVCDLVLLENQIPFFFLDEIFKCTIAELDPGMSLVTFMVPVLLFLNLFDLDAGLGIVKNISIDDTHHILSLLHEFYKPQKDGIIPEGCLSTRNRSAVDLDKAGVKFKPNRSQTWVLGMEMEFPCFLWSWCKCTLRMPVLNVHDSTELILRNLIAYELESRQTRKYITSYAFVMDALVNTQDDVAKLVDSKVLNNIMGSNEEAANMINNICKHVALVDSFYTQQWKTLDKYSNNYWPKHIAWMRRTYFSSPWNIIALFVGSILFALTMVQTIFTINGGSK
ncbi:hypothetical protein R6Q59_026841 [Mikania micrantha]|uniref:Uncharacterized protein n=1 Tax=Mikania micrantha TaxID=192012 RepID=A0A5N6M6V0_9ASTR|nr:hypothetical protein E3N88_31602 [Mikania micrantha]